jgi:hypothetical protein
VFAEGSSLGISRSFWGTNEGDGFSLTYKSYFGDIINFRNNWKLTGYWNTDLSYYKNSGDDNPQFSNITVLSLTPTFRYTRQFAYENGLNPFFDAGFGIAGMNRDQFADNQLGGYFSFRQSYGFGFIFGAESQYAMSYHYLVLDNQGQGKENDGLFFNTIEFDYWISNGS